MITDRLEELKATQLDNEHLSQVTVPGPSGSSSFMVEFFNQVGEIQENIDKINIHIKEVKKRQDHILATPLPTEKMNQELKEHMIVLNNMANKVGEQLKTIEQKIEKEEPKNKIYAQYRIQKGHHSALSHNFVIAMTHYSEVQTQYKEGCKGRIQRQLLITGRRVTPEEFEAMLENDNLTILTQGIITETDKNRNTLSDIKARHNDLTHLEANIKELHNMFLDMAVFIESQGELVDRIEYNMEQVVDYVEDAKMNTTKSVYYKRSTRRFFLPF